MKHHISLNIVTATLAALAFTVVASRSSLAETLSQPSAHAIDLNAVHKTVTVDGIEIVYREAGPKDAPSVPLLHGFPTSSQMYRNLIPQLADKYHVVAPDYPGFGHSEMPPRDKFAYTFDNLSRVLDRFTQQIGLHSFALYVQDYGAPIGFRIAETHPDRVTALVVQNGNAYDEGLDNDFWKPIKAYWNASNDASNAETPVLTDWLSEQGLVDVHEFDDEVKVRMSRNGAWGSAFTVAEL